MVLRFMLMKVIYLFYIVDLKIFVVLVIKLERVMGMVKVEMECVWFRWSEKKCVVVYVKRGIFDWFRCWKYEDRWFEVD